MRLYFNRVNLVFILITLFSLSASAVANDRCVIKGNISSSGERIYHVPGQKYYSKTKISPSKGERWFCTEKEAREAGWRKAKV